MTFLKPLLATAAASLLALAPMSSHATLILTLDDLSTAGVDVTVVDQAANDALTDLGLVAYVGKVGAWTTNVSTGAGNGTSSIFGIDLNSFNASSSAGGTLRLSLTETDLVWGSSGPLSITSLIGGTTQGSVSYSAFVDDSNAAFGQATTLFSGSSSSSVFADGNAMTVPLTDPFSLTLQVDITHAGKKNTSFDFSSQVPEPGTLALLSVALLGAGAATRRRKR